MTRGRRPRLAQPTQRQRPHRSTSGVWSLMDAFVRDHLMESLIARWDSSNSDVRPVTWIVQTPGAAHTAPEVAYRPGAIRRTRRVGGPICCAVKVAVTVSCLVAVNGRPVRASVSVRVMVL